MAGNNSSEAQMAGGASIASVEGRKASQPLQFRPLLIDRINKRKRQRETHPASLHMAPRCVLSSCTSITRMNCFVLPFLLCLSLGGLPSFVKATLSCDPTSTSFGDTLCAQKLRPGSICDPVLKRCTNPFARGCLSAIRLGTNKYSDVRVCNSNDDDDDDDKYYDIDGEQGAVRNNGATDSTTEDRPCMPPPFNYTEIRIHAGTWDSSLALAWIYQIFLSERLQVPVTIVGKSDHGKDKELSFYHLDNAFAVADQAYDWDPLEMTNLLSDGDCRHADPHHLPCAHLMPQIWDSALPRWDQAVKEDTIPADDSSSSHGMMGKTNLYIPQRTAQRYPGLVGYYGLQSASPQQLAQLFRQPISWGDYCQKVSVNNCIQSDRVAHRVPMTTEEAVSFYQPGLFTGFFGNATEMGHIIAPSSCDEFTSNTLEAQLYYNNISLQSQGPLLPNQGYDLNHVRQIYQAANATQSDVIIWWWSPDSLIEVFRGTDYEMQAVTMPEYTRECGDHQTSAEARCSPDLLERLGSEKGACDTPGHHLRQAIALSVQGQNQDTDLVDQSPTFDTLRNIRVTDFDMKDILRRWGAARNNVSSEHQFGYEVREAVCSWVADHVEDLDSAIPEGYPRTAKDTDGFDQPYLFGAQAVATIASLLVLCASIASVYWRRRVVVVQAQGHFVFQILLGLWLLTMAAIVNAKEPSDIRCSLNQWFITLGFTFVLIPLVVKVVTMNYIAITMRKGRDHHITISPLKMFLVELSLAICAIMYLMVWTASDPISRVEIRKLKIEDGSNFVETTISCSSDSDGWIVASFIPLRIINPGCFCIRNN